MVQSRIHPSRLTQTERKEISDSRMLDPAVDLIVETGAEKLTLKAVGEKAGYSRGLAGYRFGNKTGFEFVLRSVGDQWRSELTRVCQGLTGKQAISAALQAHQNLCEAAPENVQTFYRLWFDALTPESSLASLIQAIQACRRDDVRGWIEAGIESGEVSPQVDAPAQARFFEFLWLASYIRGLEIQITLTRCLHFTRRRTSQCGGL